MNAHLFKVLPLVDNTLSSLCLVYKLISGENFSKIGILFIVFSASIKSNVWVPVLAFKSPANIIFLSFEYLDISFSISSRISS